MNNNIQTIRQNLNMSRRQLAELLGLTVQAIANYEYGTRNPKIKICYRLIDLAQRSGLDLKLEDIYMQDTA